MSEGDLYVFASAVSSELGLLGLGFGILGGLDIDFEGVQSKGVGGFCFFGSFGVLFRGHAVEARILAYLMVLSSLNSNCGIGLFKQTSKGYW